MKLNRQQNRKTDEKNKFERKQESVQRDMSSMVEIVVKRVSL